MEGFNGSTFPRKSTKLFGRIIMIEDPLNVMKIKLSLPPFFEVYNKA